MKKIICAVIIGYILAQSVASYAQTSHPETNNQSVQNGQNASGSINYAPDSLWVTPYCGVYHFDRNKIRNGRRLNETPSCIGGKAGWNINNNFKTGLIVNSFRNSIYKRTVVAGAYIEKDLLPPNAVVDTCGIGGMAGGQLVKGYDIPLLAEFYGYCEKWRLRANAAFVPPLGSAVDSAIIWTVDFKLWQG